jgi:translation elongation factor EF-Ts
MQLLKRFVSSSSSQMLLRLRKEFEGVSITRVREALHSTNGVMEEAREYLRRDLLNQGQKKSQKVTHRKTEEGMVVIAQRPGVGAVMGQVGCETDFVARSGIFLQLARQCAASALFYGPSSGGLQLMGAEEWFQLPLFPGSNNDKEEDKEERSVRSIVEESVGRLGENIQLKQPAFLARQLSAQHMVAVGIHGQVQQAEDLLELENVSLMCGKAGALILLEFAQDKESTRVLCNQLCQHIIGLSPNSIQELYEQPFLYSPDGESVQQVLEKYSLRITQFARLSTNAEPIVSELSVSECSPNKRQLYDNQ